MDERFLKISREMMLSEDRSEKGIITNDPKDPGGKTRWGVSQRSYPDVDLDSLTREGTLELYYRDWYVRYHYDEIKDDELVAEILDIAVTNPHKAHECIQRAVITTMGEYLEVDGVMGPKTVAAINQHPNPAWLLDRFKLLAIEHYLGCRNDRFLAGWVRRALD